MLQYWHVVVTAKYAEAGRDETFYLANLRPVKDKLEVQAILAVQC